MNRTAVRKDLDFLIENPGKSLMSAYHDAGSCWLLIEAAVKEIRKLRRELNEGRQEKRGPP